MAGKRLLTNKFNLPETLVKAVQYDTHRNAGTISVTVLIDGAQIRYLKGIHDYETDVVDNLFALLGTCMHMVLERANIESVRQRAFILTAETLMDKAKEFQSEAPDKASQLENGAKWLFKLIPIFFPEVNQRYIFEETMTLPFGNHVISGTFDLYDKHTGILLDYKVCSTFNWTHPEARIKWEEQTNIYAYMLASKGITVTGIRIVAFFRDWNANGKLRNSDYPDLQIKEIVMPLWPFEQTKEIIMNHLYNHQQADQGIVPPCDGKVRWATADSFAIYNLLINGKKNKRALRLVNTEPAAKAWIEQNKHLHSELVIEKRPGESRRCQSYCQVNKFCSQYQAELAANKTL